MRELKQYIHDNRPKYGFLIDVSKRLSSDGVKITPEGIARIIQPDNETHRPEVLNMCMRVLAEISGMNNLYNESSNYILKELKNK
jgi:hypothetical protein